METVQFQIFVFSITLYGGIIIGILYDVYRAVKGKRRTKSLITSLWDILFLLFTFFISIWIIFSSNYGDLRVYVFIGFMVGFFLYERIIGRIATALFSQILKAISTMIKIGSNYTSLPLRFLWYLILKPIIAVGNFFKIAATKIKKKARIPKKTLKEWAKYYKLIIKRGKQ